MKEDFTEYDIKPEDFLNYLRYYGKHFNKKLCNFACKQMNTQQYNKDNLELLLKSLQIDTSNYEIYDAVYLANYCKSIYFGSAIPDEKHLLLFIKDTLDKESHLIFNRWYADMAKQGVSIKWEEMI